ncbi:hypothetical protein A1D31_24970 [Bradyrhizobium liaoningense]|nr:hypothetical protein A1D31_24970 [Bradyrhizobium liaoningense]
MSRTSITKNITTALLAESIKLAWALIRFGQNGYCSSRAPIVVARLYRRLLSAGEALKGWTERTAGWLGTDILDVLARVGPAPRGV